MHACVCVCMLACVCVCVWGGWGGVEERWLGQFDDGGLVLKSCTEA